VSGATAGEAADPVARFTARRLRWLALLASLLLCSAVAAAPEPQDLPGKTALMGAAQRGVAAQVMRLLRHGADVNARNRNGGTALMYAALGGHVEVVDLLLRHGARTDLKGSNGWGPLMIAAVKGHADVAERLLEAGADPNTPDVYGWTPLMRAIYERRGAVAARLMQRRQVAINVHSDRGSTPLHLAAMVGARDIAEQLIARGADRTLRDEDGRTPADIARARNDRELARVLAVSLGRIGE